MKIGIYAGTFDPLTNGHLDMLQAAAHLVDHLIIAIGVHPAKTPLFTAQERLAMVQQVVCPLLALSGVEPEICTFDGLLVHLAQKKGAKILFRGLRDGTDLDYEMQLVGMNQALDADIQTVFLPSTPQTRHITATLVRQIAQMHGDVAPFVPPLVVQHLQQRFASA